MFTFKKSKRVINIVIEDCIVRILESNIQQIANATVIVEKPLPFGLIENGKITDEIQFYSFINELVKEFSLKNRLVHFYVPNSLVIMRQVEYPSHLKNKEEIVDYFSLELGKSIHLPFKEPVFDLYYLSDDANENSNPEMTQLQQTRRAVLFAAPKEEMQRYTDILVDASLKPILADVNALGVYRYFQEYYPVNQEGIYLFVELNITSINLSIFSADELEFLRYQELDIQLAGWKINEETNEIMWQYINGEEVVQGVIRDQVLELGRIMNFYRYSMHQGEKQITDIVIIGDHPNKAVFYQRVKEQFDLTVQLLGNHQTKYGEIDSAFIPALGLAIEGGTSI